MQEKIISIINRLIVRIIGLAIIAFSTCCLLSLLTYNSSDPSFNSFSTVDNINNLFGSFGSHISDLLFQLVGGSAFFLCLIVTVIGYKILISATFVNILPKIILTPLFILSFSAFFATIPQPSWWNFVSLGGVNGAFIIAQTSIFIPNIVTAFLSFIFAIILLSIIIEVSLKDWIYFYRYFVIILWGIFEKVMFFIKENDLKLKVKTDKFDENFEDIKISKSKIFATVDEDEDQEINIIEKPKEKIETREELKSRLKSKKIKPSNSSEYQLPPIDLLIDRSAENKDKKIPKQLIDQQSELLVKVLEDFGVKGELVGAKVGPVITLHEFEPIAGTKASRIIGLSEDIARSMSAVSARISVISGKTSIGIELPNPKREMIFLRELVENKEYRFSEALLPMILGKNIGGDISIADLAKMPHLLIAGTTGSGKSVGLNVMILSLLFKLRPDECKFIMIDPKMLELSIYDGIPHLLSPVVTEPAKAVVALKWVVAEMEERYRMMSSFAVRNILGYNEKVEKASLNNEKLKRKVQTGYDPTNGQPIIEEIEFEPKKLPYIVVIVDEMADLMLVAGKEIEGLIQRLAQMARAAGIHIITATQRPSVDVITGVIKANFPTRISFQVTSRIDSRTILGDSGAEQLLGRGDMIYMAGGSKTVRVHGPFCSDTEIENIVGFIKDQHFEESGEEDKISFDAPIIKESPESQDLFDFKEGGGDEDLYNKAVAIVRRDKKVSISYVQRQLRIGYNRSANLIERMEQEGVISEPNSSGKREIIE